MEKKNELSNILLYALVGVTLLYPVVYFIGYLVGRFF